MTFSINNCKGQSAASLEFPDGSVITVVTSERRFVLMVSETAHRITPKSHDLH